LVLALGAKYWLIIPFAFTSQLPAIPIKGRLLEFPEITAVLCTAVFLVRYAVKRQAFTLFRKQHAPFLLYVGWVALIFAFNPVGLSDAGSSLGGARFYAKIVLALAAFLIMANQEITEKDCKWVIILILIGGVLESIYQISVYFIPVGLDPTVQQLMADPDNYYSWHQGLARVPILLVALAFSRYKSSEIFSFNRPWAVFALSFCLLIIAMSGKRAALASVPLLAILGALLRREWGFVMLWLASAAVAAGVIIIGHGDLFHLPLTVQRAFSALPAQWDPQLGDLAGGKDLFRAELRRKAMKKIEQDPLIGTGYQVNLSLAQALTAQYARRGGDTELQTEPFAMGSAWHNTWLGYAADFGIPASMIAALIFFSVIRTAYRLSVRFPLRSMRSTLATYFFLTTTIALLRSHTSGHSALDAFGGWWSYGALVSLWFAYAKAAATSQRGEALSPLAPVPAWGTSTVAGRRAPGSRARGARPGALVSGGSRR
jgi:hypothetical protein